MDVRKADNVHARTGRLYPSGVLLNCEHLNAQGSLVVASPDTASGVELEPLSNQCVECLRYPKARHSWGGARRVVQRSKRECTMTSISSSGGSVSKQVTCELRQTSKRTTTWPDDVTSRGPTTTATISTGPPCPACPLRASPAAAGRSFFLPPG